MNEKNTQKEGDQIKNVRLKYRFRNWYSQLESCIKGF